MSSEEHEPLLDQHAAGAADRAGDYGCTATAIKCLVESPPSFFHSARERRFRNGIANGQYQHDNPCIVFRGSRRPPNEIFANGFSAYSPKKAMHWAVETGCCVWWSCCPCFMLPLSLICCIPSFIDENSFCYAAAITGFCGQDKFIGPYVSNWSALALTTQYTRAKPYMTEPNTYWRYIIYLPDGYVDFTQFSDDVVDDGGEIYDDDDNTSGARDVGEVIPKGEQQISGHYIIAAVQYQATSCEPLTIKINSDFIYLDQLAAQFDIHRETTLRPTQANIKKLQQIDVTRFQSAPPARSFHAN